VRRPPPLTGVPEALDELTPREREVMVFVARGLSNDQIAATLVVSLATVKTHVNRILAKLRAPQPCAGRGDRIRDRARPPRRADGRLPEGAAWGDGSS
jgi:DNA-binding NarL/FixJ family response regulator